MNKPIKTDDLSFAHQGLGPANFAELTDPDRDPALFLPAYATETAVRYDPDSAIPSVKEIEEALMDHIHGNHSPIEMVQKLLSPFEGYIELTPGKGLKRPTYQVEMKEFALLIPRSHPREVAERLYYIATTISRYRIGNRAPEEAPTILCRNHDTREFKLRTSSVDAAVRAHEAISPWPIKDVKIHLPIPPSGIATHVLAARELLNQRILGKHQAREMALSVLSLSQHLRAAASVIMKRNDRILSRTQHFIHVQCGPNPKVEIKGREFDSLTSHEKIDFVSNHVELLETLKEIADASDIIKKLPSEMFFSLSADTRYVGIDFRRARDSSDISQGSDEIASLEYQHINKLAEAIEASGVKQAKEQHRWYLSLGYGCRSDAVWRLQGETLADAIANEIEEEGSRLSMVVTDLLIDILEPEEADGVRLYRLIDP
jgi:hypothetical protein